MLRLSRRLVTPMKEDIEFMTTRLKGAIEGLVRCMILYAVPPNAKGIIVPTRAIIKAFLPMLFIKFALICNPNIKR